jgi:tetratricopeptide (TPR) repeat protein
MRPLLAAVLLIPILGGALAEGARRFRAGDYAGAARVYAAALERGDASPRIRYGLGTALLAQGRWDEARAVLGRTAGDAPPGVAWPARYNAGNADLEPVVRGDTTARRERLRRAVEAYRGALRLRPDDSLAKWNLELAQRLLREPPEEVGGGGGGDSEDDSESEQDRAQPQPSPAPRPAPSLTRPQASRLLDAIERREAELQRDKLRQPRGSPRVLRDW